MPYGPFEEETLLDLTVNMIPLGMLVFFLALILTINPWGTDAFQLTIATVLHLVPIVALALLTYIAGLIVQRDEKAAETAVKEGQAITEEESGTESDTESVASEDR